MKKKSVIIAVISLIIVVLLIGLVYILTGQKDANNKLEEGYTYYYLEKDKVANFNNVSIADNNQVDIYVNYNAVTGTEDALATNVKVETLMNDVGEKVNYSNCTNIVLYVPTELYETLTMLSVLDNVTYNINVNNSDNEELKINNTLKETLENSIQNNN